MKKILFIWLLFGASCSIYSGNDAELLSISCVGRCYRGEVITPSNITQFIGDLPGDLALAVYKFLFSRPAPSGYLDNTFMGSLRNELYIRGLIQPIDLSGFQQNITEVGDQDPAVAIESLLDVARWLQKNKQRDDKLALAIMETSNLARNNYVFHCPGAEDWLIKIASPGSRLTNLFTAAGFNVYTKQLMKDRDVNLAALNGQVTYQTISIAQISLMLRDLIENNRLRFIYVPRTYLYQFTTVFSRNGNDTPSKLMDPNDTNCFVVQEFVPGLKHLFECPELIADRDLITVEMVAELKMAIQYAGLWNLKYNLAICLDENSPHYRKLILFDTEQRNLTSPAEFMSVSVDIFNWITATGLRECIELFASRQDLVEILQN